MLELRNSIEGSDFRQELNRMEFPSEEFERSMNIEELFTLFRKNHELLIKALSSLDLEKFPCLATHGALGDGIAHLENNNLPVSVWVNVQKPQNIEEAASILYGLTSSAIAHARAFGQMSSGGYLVLNLGTDYEKASGLFNKQNFVKIDMSHLRPMGFFPKPLDEKLPLSENNWKYQEAESDSERHIFYTISQLENNKVLSAAEIDSGKINSLKSKLKLELSKDLPNYRELIPENNIIDGYRKAVAFKLECLFSIKIILEKLMT